MYFVITETIGEVAILYKGEAIELDWEDYGLRLYLPDSALPHGVTDCLIQIKAFLSCEYDAGEADLISGVYQISSAHSFTKPVRLHIQHFSCSTKSLCFGINSDLKHPYQFELVDSGHFHDSSYGVISAISFSIYSIFEKKKHTDILRQEYRYRCHLLYSTAIRYGDILKRNVYFVIIKDSYLSLKVNSSYTVSLIIII